MAIVTSTRATGSAAPGGRPRASKRGGRSPARVAPPKEAERKPASVTPTCTAARNRFGSSASLATDAPRRPRPAIARTWLSRSETRAISAAANMLPTRTNTTTSPMLASVPLTVWSPGGPFVHAHNDKGLQVGRRLGRVAPVDFPADVPVLTDGTVTLRAHRPDDAGAVLEQCTDPVSQRWTTVPVPYSPQDATRFVTEIVRSGWTGGSWAFAVE